jgi:putative FmdB family regulatory protein
MRQKIRGNNFGKILRRKTPGGKLVPKYDYSCIQCDLDYEKERSIHDNVPAYFCTKCGYSLQRVYTDIGFSFKGGGFYSTDRKG